MMPVTSLTLETLALKPPLRGMHWTSVEVIYIENKSNIELTITEPCWDARDSSNNRIGWMDPRIEDLNGRFLAHACWWQAKVPVGGMVKMYVQVHDLSPLSVGNHTFTTVIGAVGSSGDGPFSPISSQAP